MFRSFCKLFSESSQAVGQCWAVLQLPCCPSKQGELSKNILRNLQNKWPSHPVHGGQVGEPIEDIWRLFEDVRDDNNGANEPILDEDTPAVMEDDDNYDPIEDLWRLFSDPPVADHEPNQPDLGDGDEHAHEMAVIDIQVARDPTQRPRAVSDASSRRNDSGIESSSPQSSNFSSVDALESSEMNDDSSESNPQQRSETLSNTMPRSTRRRRANQNDTAVTHTKKPRSC